jgi:hypothetical protein
VSCLHSVSIGSKPMISLSLAVLPEQGSHLILAMGGLDHKIHIYCGDKSGKVCNLNAIATLSPFFWGGGHVSCVYYLNLDFFSMCSSLKPVNLKATLIGSGV